MRDLVITEMVTIDGVMEAPETWLLPYIGDDYMQYKLQETREASAHLLGRTTYDSFVGAWPHRSGPLAERINAMPKYVVTSTDPEPWENVAVVGVDEVAALKQEDGGPIIVVGSRTLTRALAAAGLVDEWRLVVAPVVAGTGGRLFDGVEATLELTEWRRLDERLQLQVFRPGSGGVIVKDLEERIEEVE